MIISLFDYTGEAVKPWRDSGHDCICLDIQHDGVKVIDGKIHVLERGQLTRLHDLNDDGEADYYECLTDEYPTAAPRPKYTVMDSSKTWATLDLRPNPWRENLRRMLEEMVS